MDTIETDKRIPACFEVLAGRLQTAKSVKSIEEYTRIVRLLTDYWELDSVWFRGHSNSNYKLLPGIYRDDSSEYDAADERHMEDEYIRRAQMYIPPSPGEYSRWYWYQVMQHHGLPTRLLDWTTAGLVALYFALSKQPEKDAAVWVLNPHDFNEFTTDNAVVYYSDTSIQDADDGAVVNNYVPSRLAMPEHPIAVSPAHSLPRIALQKGCFTIHGRGKKAIEDTFRNNTKPALAKILISGNKAHDIRTDLSILGIVETSLFPDLDGLARELRWECGI